MAWSLAMVARARPSTGGVFVRERNAVKTRTTANCLPSSSSSSSSSCRVSVALSKEGRVGRLTHRHQLQQSRGRGSARNTRSGRVQSLFNEDEEKRMQKMMLDADNADRMNTEEETFGKVWRVAFISLCSFIVILLFKLSTPVIESTLLRSPLYDNPELDVDIGLQEGLGQEQEMVSLEESE